MALEITTGALPNIVCLTLSGKLEFQDLNPTDALKLDEMPKYLFVDASHIQIGVPDGFLTGARQSPLLHPNCLFAAIYVRSELLKNAMMAGAKLARVQHKLKIFTDADEAMAHLVALAQGG